MSSEMKNAMVGAVVGDIAGSRFESLVYEGWGIMTSRNRGDGNRGDGPQKP